MSRKFKNNQGSSELYSEDTYSHFLEEEMALISEGDFEDALLYNKQLGIMAPNVIETKLKRGFLESRLGHCKDAMECFNALITGDLSDVYVYSHMALCNYENGNLETAVEYCRKALELQSDALSWYIKGLCLKEKCDNEGAVVSFGSALELEPDYAVLWAEKGSLLAKMNRYDEADECFKRALEIVMQASNPEMLWHLLGGDLYS